MLTKARIPFNSLEGIRAIINMRLSPVVILKSQPEMQMGRTSIHGVGDRHRCIVCNPCFSFLRNARVCDHTKRAGKAHRLGVMLVFSYVVNSQSHKVIKREQFEIVAYINTDIGLEEDRVHIINIF